MKTQVKTTVLARVALALALVLSLSLAGMPAGALGAVDMTKTGTLTFQMPNETEEDRDMIADLLAGGEPDEVGKNSGAAITIELYKVADINSSGTYTVVSELAGGGFAKLAETVSEDWQKNGGDVSYWQNATAVLLNEIYDPTELTTPETEDPFVVPTVNKDATCELTAAETVELNGNYMAGVSDLDLGLYLAVAKPVDGKLYTYTFTPWLLSVPMLDPAEYTEGMDPTEGAVEGRLYAYTATLKPQREHRLGQLVIKKALARYNKAWADASFVFSVKAELDGEVLYSNVFTIKFSEAGEKELLVPELPVGATVTVTEVYSGASYTLTTGKDQEVVIPAPDAELTDDWIKYPAPPVEGAESEDVTTAVVRFENDYDGHFNGGVSADNKYTKGDGGWSWTQTDAPAAGDTDAPAGD